MALGEFRESSLTSQFMPSSDATVNFFRANGEYEAPFETPSLALCESYHYL